MKIRKAKAEDLSEVYEIEKASFNDPYPFDFLKALRQLYTETFLVAETHGSIRGYAIATLDRGSGHILSIAIQPSSRRQHIGQRLVNAIVKILTRQGVTIVRLEVRKSNIIAQKFYEKLGFMYSHIVPQYYDNEDGRVYYKVLE